MKNEPLDKKLYEQIKQLANEKYVKSSAYKSGWIVKTYKSLGGRYSGTKTKEGLARWYSEKWTDIRGKNIYTVYRQTKRINRHTTLTIREIDKKQ